MKNLACAILTVSTILTASTTAVLAEVKDGNNTGSVQNNVQTSVITGNNNATVQQSRQVNKIYRNGSSGDDVNVQDSDQYCDTLGDGNVCAQESVQKNSVRRRNFRR